MSGMISADIRAEIGLAKPLGRIELDGFSAQGVRRTALAWTAFGEFDILALDRVVLDGDRFEYARYVRHSAEPVNAYVVGIRNTCGDLNDMMAWTPGHRPATWLGRCSMAGMEQLFMPRRDFGDAIDVHFDPLEWLKAGRCGVLLLNCYKAARDLDGVTLRTTSPEQARQLRVALARPAPRIEVAEQGGTDCASFAKRGKG